MKGRNCAPSDLGIGAGPGHQGGKVHRASGVIAPGIVVTGARVSVASVVKADLREKIAANALQVATDAKGLAVRIVIAVRGLKGGSHRPRRSKWI